MTSLKSSRSTVILQFRDSLRPCTHDASDAAQAEKTGQLTRRAWEHDVQVMVEGQDMCRWIKLNLSRKQMEEC